MRDEGGVSETDAKRLGRLACDAVFFARVMFNDNETFSVETASIVGQMPKEGEPSPPFARYTTEALFDVWTRLGAYIARDAATHEPPTEDETRIRRFVLAVLLKLQLDENMVHLSPMPATTEEQVAEAPPAT